MKKIRSIYTNFVIFLLFIIVAVCIISSCSTPLGNFFNSYSINDNININQSKNNIPQNDYNIRVLFCPDDNCELKLKSLMIDSNTIFCAVYDIDLPWIYDVIKQKSDENKSVGLIEDDKQYESVFKDYNKDLQNKLIELKNKNILKTDKRPSDYMHNKFCIFDENLIWVGSFNFTDNAANYNNNNVLLMRDYEIHELFADEFFEMWSGTFNGGNKNPEQIEYPKVYFCPEDNCAQHYVDTLNLAKKNVWCMFFDMTHQDVGNKLIELKEKGLDVKAIFESRQIGQYSYYSKLDSANIDVIKDKNPKTMHNKFCIIDDSYVITGSMNPSKHSDEANDESIIVINDKDLINKYLNYFKLYWSKWS